MIFSFFSIVAQKATLLCKIPYPIAGVNKRPILSIIKKEDRDLDFLSYYAGRWC
jgi:hypothetical protein